MVCRSLIGCILGELGRTPGTRLPVTGDVGYQPVASRRNKIGLTRVAPEIPTRGI